ncbi:hypothetical protein EVAR_14919_1 [Eumeta japonica]|uniref:Uncharacterized protein n=1 Tax=Eumeta variegata TaxID=151549 RepID=A0A4C1XKN8_EUMVA|nr:hypothetical protein EVAR_14919_1 [Eumeta japonica]
MVNMVNNILYHAHYEANEIGFVSIRSLFVITDECRNNRECTFEQRSRFRRRFDGTSSIQRRMFLLGSFTGGNFSTVKNASADRRAPAYVRRDDSLAPRNPFISDGECSDRGRLTKAPAPNRQTRNNGPARPRRPTEDCGRNHSDAVCAIGKHLRELDDTQRRPDAPYVTRYEQLTRPAYDRIYLGKPKAADESDTPVCPDTWTAHNGFFYSSPPLSHEDNYKNKSGLRPPRREHSRRLGVSKDFEGAAWLYVQQ